jgi:hypothetical protein
MSPEEIEFIKSFIQFIDAILLPLLGVPDMDLDTVKQIVLSNPEIQSYVYRLNVIMFDHIDDPKCMREIYQMFYDHHLSDPKLDTFYINIMNMIYYYNLKCVKRDDFALRMVLIFIVLM